MKLKQKQKFNINYLINLNWYDIKHTMIYYNVNEL